MWSAAAAATTAAAAAAAAPAAAAAAPAVDATPLAGILCYAGAGSHSMAGRKDPPASAFDGVPDSCVASFVKMPIAAAHSTPAAPVAADATPLFTAVFSGPTASHYVAIDVDGNVYVWGRNERGQLGLDHMNNVYLPTKVTGLPRIVSAACGRSHTFLVTAEGDVYGAGESKMSQLGLGSPRDLVIKWTRVPSLKNIAKMGAGADFSMALSKEGAVFAAGSEAFGQCGTGKTGEYIVTAGRSAFTHVESFSPVLPLTGMRIKDIACGANHTVALEADGLVYTWGAGGYGRCGHGDAKDVLIPTLVKAFEAPRFRVSTIAAGATCTYAVQTLTKALMFFGIAKRSGDATLAPKMVMDLAGWNIRCVAAGSTSTIVASETSLVTWGPSPTHGELGYGEDIKSSTKPKLVDSLEGCTIIDVAAGASASLILVSTAGLALPDSIATYTPPIKVLTPLADAAAATSAIAAADASAAAGGAGKKRGRPAGGASAATSKATGKAGAAKSGAAAKRRG